MADIKFLYEIAHQYAHVAPSLSSFYLSRLYPRLRKDLSLQNLSTHCQACHAVFVPGTTCSVRLVHVDKHVAQKAAAGDLKKGGGNAEKPEEAELKEKEEEEHKAAHEGAHTAGEETAAAHKLPSKGKAKEKLCQRMKVARTTESYQKRGKATRSNVALYLCHVCGRETEFYGAVRGRNNEEKAKSREKRLAKKKRVQQKKDHQQKPPPTAQPKQATVAENRSKSSTPTPKDLPAVTGFSFSSFLGRQPEVLRPGNSPAPASSGNKAPKFKSQSAGVTPAASPSPTPNPKLVPLAKPDAIGKGEMKGKGSTGTPPPQKIPAATMTHQRSSSVPPPAVKGDGVSKAKNKKLSLIKKMLDSEEKSQKKKGTSFTLADFLKEI